VQRLRFSILTNPNGKFAADKGIPPISLKLLFIALTAPPRLVRVNEGRVSAVIDRRRSYFDTIKSELSVNFEIIFASFLNFHHFFEALKALKSANLHQN